MARYRKVDVRIWGDEKFRDLAPADRLAWFYILTSDQTSMVGLYRLSIEQMAEELGVGTASVRRSIGVLEQRHMIRFDASTRLLWVPRWLEYNPPSGSNQAKAYHEAATGHLPHRFAIALRIVTLAALQGTPGSRGMLTKKQAILIRDGVQCVYCREPLLRLEDTELDHVLPESRRTDEPNSRYEHLVACCKSCNRQKGTRTAEEFGHPFVTGRPYGIADAVRRLIYEPPIRAAFAALCHGLPVELEGIDEVSELLDVTASERRRNAVGTPSLERRDAMPTQEQEQEEDTDTERESLASSDAFSSASENAGTYARSSIRSLSARAAGKTAPPTPLPHEYPLSEALAAVIAALGCADPPALHAQFCDYAWGRGWRKVDWLATERSWARTAHTDATKPCPCVARRPPRRAGYDADGVPIHGSMRSAAVVAAKLRQAGEL